MAKLRLVVALIAMTACVHRDATVDTRFPEPEELTGPPGGDIEASWQAAGSPTSSEVVASADVSAPGTAIGTVTDVEIDQTLDGYGEWIWEDAYGWVWRPYATEVGLDFTPYETCGSWVWTDDYGWVYGCDWDWGWLPFHYGQWGWFDDYWAWVPDYEWSPGWVDWRGGGGYVGWAPTVPKIRDHRHHLPRDHRYGDRNPATAQGGVVVRQRDSHWRFATVDDFGKRNIRAHLFKHAAEGLRVTSLAPRPPIRGNVRPVAAASVMQDRLAAHRARAAAATYSPPAFTPRGPIRSASPLVREAPTAVEVPMENPPSIYEPGDRFREPTQSPIRSSSPPIDNSTPSPPLRTTPPVTTTPLRNSLPPDAATWAPPPIQPQRVPPPSASTWTPPPPPVRHEPSRTPSSSSPPSSSSHSPSSWGSTSSGPRSRRH